MVREVPAWRREAGAGIPLSAAKLRLESKASLPAKGTALPDGDAETASLPGGLSRSLGRILRPQAAYRWLLPQLAAITPQYIEMTLRGALAGNHVQAWELFDLMEDSWPRLSKNANQLKMEVVEEMRGWRAKPYEEEDTPASDSAKEKARLVNAALRGMRPEPDADENDLSGTIYDLMDAWLKGQAVLETDWEVRAAGAAGNIVAPRSTYWVHPTCVAWSMEGRLGLRQELAAGLGAGQVPRVSTPGVWGGTSAQPMPSSVVPFPEHKFLIGIVKAKSGSALAAARLRSLAWWWCAGNFAADWLLNLAQLWQLPFRWANYDPNAPQATVDAICAMLENMGSNAWAAFPAGTTMELKESKQSGGNGPADNILDRADKNCDLLVLGQTLTSDVSQDAGSRSQGEVHERVEDKIMRAACGYVAGVLNNQLVPAILELNYGNEEEKPEYRGDEEVPGTLEFQRTLVTNLSQHEILSRVLANQINLKETVRNAGLPVNEDYTDPYVPVVENNGSNVTGDVNRDAEGDIIGAKTDAGAETSNSKIQTPGQSRDTKANGAGAPEKPEKPDAPLKAVEAAPEPELVQAGVDQYAAAVADDLQLVRERVAALMQISDPNLLRQRAVELSDEIEKLKADILKQPKAARALAEIQTAALFTGLTEGSKP